ncbi:hypothetical protein [Streptomyces sp. NPDC059080]|uniref:hypothetical protein n=1 Tax=Streptomyces sp. NPDC059080 TaxID=3346718 RepID=UPI0036C8F633
MDSEHELREEYPQFKNAMAGAEMGCGARQDDYDARAVGQSVTAPSSPGCSKTLRSQGLGKEQPRREVAVVTAPIVCSCLVQALAEHAVDPALPVGRCCVCPSHTQVIVWDGALWSWSNQQVDVPLTLPWKTEGARGIGASECSREANEQDRFIPER